MKAIDRKIFVLKLKIKSKDMRIKHLRMLQLRNLNHVIESKERRIKHLKDLLNSL